MTSASSFISVPFIVIAVLVFVIIVVLIFPQATVDMQHHSDAMNAQLEVHSMIMAQFHGEDFESEEGTPISNYRAKSYLLCGNDLDESWLLGETTETIETGTLELPTHYEFRVDNPEHCGDSLWDSPEPSGISSDAEENYYYRYQVPVRGGETAEVTFEYGFD